MRRRVLAVVLLVICLALSRLSLAGPVGGALSPGELPRPPAWPADLPPMVDSPAGTFLPKPLADAVAYRLAWCDGYPTLAESILRARLDEAETRATARAVVARAEGAADAKAGFAALPWPWIAGGTFVLGIIAGVWAVH